MFQLKMINRERVISAIDGLQAIEKDKAVKKGLGDAGRIFMLGGKRRLRGLMKSGPKGVTGNLLRSFQVRVKKNKPGVLIGFKRGINGGNHVHLVDRGTKKRPHPLTGTSGVMPSNRFWSDTEAQDYPKAIDKLYEGVEKAVERIKNRN